MPPTRSQMTESDGAFEFYWLPHVHQTAFCRVTTDKDLHTNHGGLGEALQAQRIEVAKRYAFYERYQEAGEMIAKYDAAKHKLATH